MACVALHCPHFKKIAYGQLPKLTVVGIRQLNISCLNHNIKMLGKQRKDESLKAITRAVPMKNPRFQACAEYRHGIAQIAKCCRKLHLDISIVFELARLVILLAEYGRPMPCVRLTCTITAMFAVRHQAVSLAGVAHTQAFGLSSITDKKAIRYLAMHCPKLELMLSIAACPAMTNVAAFWQNLVGL
jgi:hypothetical protein